MLTFEKSILHILDSEHNNCVISEKCMELREEIISLLEGKTNKVFSSAKKKKGSFKEDSIFREWIEQMIENRLSFEELSEKIAQCIFEAKMKYGLYTSSDLVISIVVYEGRRYLLGIENSYHQGITHTTQCEEKTCNELCIESAILSDNLVKEDRVFLVELSDFSVHCIETKVSIESEKVNFFADIILHTKNEPSYQEAVKSISKTVEKMADKYELEDLNLVPKMKRIIKDKVENQTPIQIEEVAQHLFSNKPLVKQEFNQELREQGIKNDIGVEYVKSKKTETMQKIRTDKGIELMIPVDYMESKDFVEFQKESDGTISIQLKNIMHISSK